MTKQAQSKKNQHYIPRLYLKGFTRPGSSSTCWVYHKGGSFHPGGSPSRDNPYFRSIQKAGASKGHYAYRTQSGSIDYNTFEDILEQQEKPSNELLLKLRAGKGLSFEEKKVFSAYIALMYRRVPKRNQFLTTTYYEIMNEIPWNSWQEHFQKAGQFGRALEVVRLREKYLANPDRELILRGMVTPLEKVPEVMSQMKWVLCVAPGTRCFVTSDSPVVFPEEKGIGNKDAFLLFPISAHVALFATWEGEDMAFVDVTETFVANLNDISMRNAHSKLFAPESSSRIVEQWNAASNQAL